MKKKTNLGISYNKFMAPFSAASDPSFSDISKHTLFQIHGLVKEWENLQKYNKSFTKNF